jgi:replicative DNA helicase
MGDASEGGMIPLGDMMKALDERRAVLDEEISRQADDLVRKATPYFVADAERIVLGSLFVDPALAFPLVEQAGLQAGDFYIHRHRIIYEAMLDLRARNRVIEVITVCDALQRRAKLEEAGGAAGLSQLEALMPSAHAAGSYAAMVVDKSKLRAVGRAAAKTMESVRLGHSVDDVIDDLEVAMEAAHRKRGGSNFADLSAAAHHMMDKLPVMGGKPEGMTTGFVDIDPMFRLVPGDFVIAAGRPSMGKTQWVIDLIREACIQRDRAVAMFSLEMSTEQILRRLVASCAGIDLKRTHMPANELSVISDVAAKVADAPLFLDESPGVTIGDIRARSRMAHRQTPLTLVIVDYLQLVDIPDSSGNVSVDIGKVSRGLKRLARELGCTVIGLSQLNRAVEQRADKRPMMSDLRESGNLEQDADVIAFLFREEYYLKDKTPDEARGVAELIVGKNRNGPTGVAKLRFDQNMPRFTSLAREWY